MRSFPIRLYPKPKTPTLYSPWVIFSLAAAGIFVVATVIIRTSLPIILYGLILITLVCFWGLSQPYPASLSQGEVSDRRGYAEFPKNALFPDQLRHFFGDDRIFILRKLAIYTPDFAYVNFAESVYIDIEVDEPYTPRRANSKDPLIPTHFVGKDDRRDRFFQQHGWAVIRFSERQVLLYPERCCKVIGEMVAELLGDPDILLRFEHISDLESEPQWTEEESLRKGKDQERLHY
jgi:hypothetical protein